MSSSAVSWRTSVLWQYSQTAKIDDADLKTTGAPQEGQEAVSATWLYPRSTSCRARSTQFLEQFRFLGVEFGLAQDALFDQPVQFFQRGHDFVSRHWRRGRSR
jgi:hypothetical protein